MSIAQTTGDTTSILPRVAFFGYVGSMIVAGLFVIVTLWRLWMGEPPEDL